MEVGGGDIFFEVLDGGCAGDGEGEFGAAEQPCERDLEGRGVELLGDASEDSMEVMSLAERRPGNESDGVSIAVVEEVVPLAVSIAVAILDGDDGCELSGAFEVVE